MAVEQGGEVPRPLVDAACRAAELDWSELDLGRPTLYFKHEQRRELHVAKLADMIDRPHIVVFIEPFGSLHGEPLFSELRHAIAHAMGHAFLRSLGLKYEQSEENAVERYARLGKPDRLFEYLV